MGLIKSVSPGPGRVGQECPSSRYCGHERGSIVSTTKTAWARMGSVNQEYLFWGHCWQEQVGLDKDVCGNRQDWSKCSAGEIGQDYLW